MMKKRVITRLLSVFILLSFENLSNAQPVESKIDDLIQPLLSDYPGIQIAISKGDKVLLTKSYGYSDLAKQTPLENNDRFRIYSVSKLITTVALLQLVEKGLIDPEKPIDKYITTWDESKINLYETKITPMHLAMHRSEFVIIVISRRFIVANNVITWMKRLIFSRTPISYLNLEHSGHILHGAMYCLASWWRLLPKSLMVAM